MKASVYWAGEGCNCNGVGCWFIFTFLFLVSRTEHLEGIELLPPNVLGLPPNSLEASHQICVSPAK